jgi:HSP20 family protein
MRLGTLANVRSEQDELFDRFFGSLPAPTWATRWDVPTDVFHADDRLIIRMELAGVRPEDVEVTVQENTLLINGTRRFPYEGDAVRFVRRGCFYGDFTQKVALGKGLDVDRIDARYDNGVLELLIPYTEEVQPKKIAIQVGTEEAKQALES